MLRGSTSEYNGVLERDDLRVLDGDECALLSAACAKETVFMYLHQVARINGGVLFPNYFCQII